jgi:hypothetical protein
MSRFQIRNCENVEQHARYFYPQASSRDVHERFKPTWRHQAKPPLARTTWALIQPPSRTARNYTTLAMSST